MFDDMDEYVKSVDEKRDKRLRQSASRCFGLVNQVEALYPGVDDITYIRNGQLIIVNLTAVKNFIKEFKYLPFSYRYILRQVIKNKQALK